ncbi:MAG: hypothetical protein ACLVLH_20115 [Eisenbergiella massiliensis]
MKIRSGLRPIFIWKMDVGRHNGHRGIFTTGMTAGPWLKASWLSVCVILFWGKGFRDMVGLALLYVAVILVVQTMRYMKRLFVRRFATILTGI